MGRNVLILILQNSVNAAKVCCHELRCRRKEVQCKEAQKKGGDAEIRRRVIVTMSAKQRALDHSAKSALGYPVEKQALRA